MCATNDIGRVMSSAVDSAIEYSSGEPHSSSLPKIVHGLSDVPATSSNGRTSGCLSAAGLRRGLITGLKGLAGEAGSSHGGGRRIPLRLWPVFRRRPLGRVE